jgi:hypothetical protein
MELCQGLNKLQHHLLKLIDAAEVCNCDELFYVPEK